KVVPRGHRNLLLHLMDIETRIFVINHSVRFQKLFELACLKYPLIRQRTLIEAYGDTRCKVHQGESILQEYVIGFVLCCNQTSNKDYCGYTFIAHAIHKICLFLESSSEVSCRHHRNFSIDRTYDMPRGRQSFCRCEVVHFTRQTIGKQPDGPGFKVKFSDTG